MFRSVLRLFRGLSAGHTSDVIECYCWMVGVCLNCEATTFIFYFVIFASTVYLKDKLLLLQVNFSTKKVLMPTIYLHINLTTGTLIPW